VPEEIVGVGGLAVFDKQREAATNATVGQQHSIGAILGNLYLRGDGVGTIFIWRCQRDVKMAGARVISEVRAGGTRLAACKTRIAA